MGKKRSTKPSQQPPQDASKSNIPPADLPTDDGSIGLSDKPDMQRAREGRRIVLQMVDGSTSTSAYFVAEPHHTVGNLRTAAIQHIRAYIAQRWGTDTAEALTPESLIVTTRSLGESTFSIPDDADRITSISQRAVFLARIAAVQSGHSGIGPGVHEMPTALATPLIDKVSQAAMSPLPPTSQPSQSTEDSHGNQPKTLAQQVQELMSAMEKMNKGMVDLEGKNEATERKLADTTKELADKNEATERKLADTKKELANTKKELTGLKAQHQEMLDSQEAIHGWISTKYPEYLDAIRARHLLNCGQAKLAVDAGLTEDNTLSRSLLWRSALANAGNTLEARRAYAVNLFNERRNLDHLTQKVISTPALLDIFVDENSPIRIAGNRAAHPPTFSKESIDSLKPAGIPSHLLDDFKQFCIAGQGLD